MNILQKVLGVIFPPYKYKIKGIEQRELLNAIIYALPPALSSIKEKNALGRVYGLQDWSAYPGFKLIMKGISNEQIGKGKMRGTNLKITGLKMYSKRTRDFESVELLVKDGSILGLKITNSDYRLNEFDLSRILSEDIIHNSFEFPPDPIDIFYNSLPPEIRDKLAIEDLEEIEFNNRTFYSFYDLEDGNFLAVDRSMKVYSLVHDARPIAKGLKVSFEDILDEIYSNQFDKESHLDDRYRNSR